MGAGQFHHTINTLKYADRAKEIKTHVRRNQGSVAMHVAQMRAVISQLQQQNSILKAMLTAPAVSYAPFVRGCEALSCRLGHEMRWQTLAPLQHSRARTTRQSRLFQFLHSVPPAWLF